jgi:hypothetical protein
MKQRKISNPYESPFLGIFEGKAKARVYEAQKEAAEAKAKADRMLEEQKRQTFLLQLEAAKQGFEPEKDKQETAVKLEETKQGSEKALYVVVGFIVVAVMVGLYFIKKR